MKNAQWVGIALLVLAVFALFADTAAAQSEACRVGQELSPGDYCTVDIPGLGGSGNRFEVRSDGLACWGGGFCGGQVLNLNGFEASRISGTLRWRIDAVPGGGNTNRPPRAVGAIPAQTLTTGGAAASVNVSRYFTDPDGDALTYSASSSRTGIVRAGASGSTVTLTPVAAGTATVTVAVRDPAGATARQPIRVTVGPAGGVNGFTDDPLVAGVTPVRAVHFRELRTRIDALRTRSGLAAYAWTDPTLRAGVTGVRSVHLTQLRTALNQAYAAAGQSRPVYTDASIRAGTTPIRAAHINDLRTAVVELENTPALMPDLVVGSPTVTDNTLTPGQSFTLSVTVRNQGTGPGTATTLRYYRSTDSAISRSDTAVGTDSVFALQADASGVESITLTAPGAEETYHYGACVDPVDEESDTENNCSSGVRVTVEPERMPDLVVGPPSVSDATVTPGDSFTLSVTVRNQGSARAATTTLRYYRSTDSVISRSDTAVGTDSVFALQADTSGVESIRLTAPSSTGTYYYGACVDPVSEEGDTGNNCSSGAQVTVGESRMPDLVVGPPSVSDATVTPGESFTLSVTVRNQGSARAATTTLRYYRSTDSVISRSDTAVGTDSVFALQADASGIESIRLTAPSSTGTYYYGACVDPVSEEGDTGNNCSSGVQVTVRSDGGGTDAVTFANLSCSARRDVGTLVDVTISGNVTARRSVSFLTITGYANDRHVGIDVLGSLSPGETKLFVVTGYISTSATTIRCRIEASYRASRGGETGATISVPEAVPIR